MNLTQARATMEAINNSTMLLTVEEDKFIENMNKQLKQSRKPSDNQANELHEIYQICMRLK